MTHTTAVTRAGTAGAPAPDPAGVDRTVIDAAQIARVGALVGELLHRDVTGLSQEDFLGAYDAAAKLGRLADTLRAQFAGDLARRSTPDLPGGGLARRQGFGNAGTMVAHVTGGTKAGAFRAIEAGRALLPANCDGPKALDQPDADQPETGQPATRSARYPALAEAARAGDLSVDAAGIITAGLESLGDRIPREQLHVLERRLVDKAVHLAAHEVRRLVSGAVAHADVVGHEERQKRQYEDRHLVWSEDHTGMVTLSGKLDPVTAAPLRTVIEQMVTHQFRARRDQDPTERDQRTVGQMRADALFELCRHAVGCKHTHESGVRTTLVVRMDHEVIATGVGLGRIDSIDQPVSAGQLRRLAGDAELIPMVLGSNSEVLDLGRKVRSFTRAQRIALLERDGGCAKCHAPPEHCEAHHIRWWERGGGTDLNNGVMLCTRCHHDIHNQGWHIQVESGQVSFIPPPTIDPLRRPRSGGLTAITLDHDDKSGSVDDTDDPNGTGHPRDTGLPNDIGLPNGTDHPNVTDPPRHDSRENSVLGNAA